MQAFYPKNLLFIRVIANYLMQSYVMLGKVIFYGNDSNLLIVFYVQIMPDDLVMQLHRF